MKPIEHYINQRIRLTEKVGSPALAKFGQLVLDKATIPEFMTWCNQDFLGSGSTAHAFHLQGFNTQEKRIEFFQDNHEVMKDLIIEMAAREQLHVSDSILKKTTNVYISAAQKWPDVFSSVDDVDLIAIFIDGDTTAGMMRRDWFINDFMQHHLLRLALELRTKVLLPYLHLLREDNMKKEAHKSKGAVS